MSIQETFDQFRETVRGVAAVMMLDKDGEAVMMSIRPDMDTFDAQLFGAQLAVMLGKKIDGQSLDFAFFRSETGAAAVRMLPNDFFLCAYFEGTSYAGYAEDKMNELARIATEEFF